MEGVPAEKKRRMKETKIDTDERDKIDGEKDRIIDRDKDPFLRLRTGARSRARSRSLSHMHKKRVRMPTTAVATSFFMG